MGGGKSTGESTGYSQSSTDQAKTDQYAGQVDQNTAQYNGPVTQTPFYKSILKAGTDSTNQAYDNATRNMKTSMEGAGVGGSSGAVQGNVAATNAQRASALGTVQPAAIQSATQNQFQADSLQSQLAGMYSGAGLGYFSGANTAEQARLARQGSMWSGLLQAGLGVASPFLGNLAKTGSWTGA